MTILKRTAEVFRRATAPSIDFAPGESADDAWRDRAVCRNCGADMATPFCGACGQKAAKRLTWRDTLKETWERVRLFELQTLTTSLRLLLSPGRIAREFVLGRRSANMHPLKLLVALVAVLVVMLAANQYFGRYAFSGRDAVVDRMAKQVLAYANWSFTLGILAIYLGSWTALRRRLGYNAIEHAVLAIYGQSVILGVVIVNMVPTLIWRDPQFVLWHKTASQYYVFAIKLLVVGAAYKQFFLLDLKNDWPRWSVALAVFAGTNWLLLRVYALAILWWVSR